MMATSRLSRNLLRPGTRRKRYKSDYLDFNMPCITNGLTFNTPLREHPLPIFSAAGTTAMTTETVDADGTYLDRLTGNVTDATANTARFEQWGLLSEHGQTNEILASEDLDLWAQGKVTVAKDAMTAPDGTDTAEIVSEDGTAADVHIIWQAVGIQNTTRYTLSVHAKAINRDWLIMAITLPSGLYIGYFDLANGVVGSGPLLDDLGIIPLANGWYRCWMSLTSGAADAGAQNFLMGPAEADNDYTFDGLSQQSTALWGAQVESDNIESGCSSYMKTVLAQTTRSDERIEWSTSGNLVAATGTLILASTANANDKHSQNMIWYCSGNQGAGNSGIWLYYGTNLLGGFTAQFYNAGALQASITDLTAGSMTQYQPHVCALTWKVNEFTIYRDGTIGQQDTSGSAPASFPAQFGFSRRAGTQAYCNVAHQLIYDRVLSQDEIKTILHCDYTRWLKGSGWVPAE